MLSIEVTAKVGGIFALLTLVHFLSDWVFQSHSEAMAKPKDSWIRAKHCLVYTVLLATSIWLAFRPTFCATFLIATVLWVSHFIEDTYLPIYIWAKYFRKPLELHENPDPKLGFQAFASTALGKILLITLDQLVHLVFLVPVAVLLVCPSTIYLVAGTSCMAIASLSYLAYLGMKDFVE